jgi:hypothetical protein
MTFIVAQVVKTEQLAVIRALRSFPCDQRLAQFTQADGMREDEWAVLAK